jgi:hypothetical protein
VIEVHRRIPGHLVDHGKFDLPRQALDECMAAITNKRGTLGEYRIRVQWLSDDDLIEERDKRKP